MTVSKGVAGGLDPLKGDASTPETIDKPDRSPSQSDAPEKVDTGANGTDVMGSGGAAPGGAPAGIGGVSGAGKGGKAAAGMAAGAAAPVAAQAAALATFLNWLKTVMMTAVAAAQSLWSMAAGALVKDRFNARWINTRLMRPVAKDASDILIRHSPCREHGVDRLGIFFCLSREIALSALRCFHSVVHFNSA